MTLDGISSEYRLPIRRLADGERVFLGKNGHLYLDNRRLMICYTDDGRKKPLTKMLKAHAITHLGAGLKRVALDCEAEFIGEIYQDAIPAAIKVLHLQRFRSTKGISRPVPESFKYCIKPGGIRSRIDPQGVTHILVPRPSGKSKKGS